MIHKVIKQYPKVAQLAFDQLYQCIYIAADELKISIIKETLKWGEPRFLVKSGNTIRINWKTKIPDHIYIFINCKSLFPPPQLRSCIAIHCIPLIIGLLF